MTYIFATDEILYAYFSDPEELEDELEEIDEKLEEVDQELVVVEEALDKVKMNLRIQNND